MTTKVSPYLKFGLAFCNKFGLFTIDEITGKRNYNPCDIWEGILLLHKHELKNRQGNNNEEN